ncbi:hypothetical protein EV699_110134 [Plasticicumulans lactativorans]|uniref:Uncharacterized protein n=1 Tax=Plasticicumulans lactativorans TaxID=1133106 RepID=A0A4R2LE17_9GAMM|nr:hypothetical protein [Plasticicumulans lactativorans]TCO81108.1 hypothetical protein EV699_110134 [Plasticicumulans lactativorans]
MRQLMNFHVLGIKRYSVDGSEGASAYVMSPAEGDPNTVGAHVMKVPCPYALVDACRGMPMPGDFQAEVELRAGAQGKLALFVLSLNPANPKSQPNPQPGNQPPANPAPKP